MKKWIAGGVTASIVALGGWFGWKNHKDGTEEKLKKTQTITKPTQIVKYPGSGQDNVEVITCPKQKICPKVKACSGPKVIYKDKIIWRDRPPKIIEREKIVFRDRPKVQSATGIGCFPDWDKGKVKAVGKAGTSVKCVVDYQGRTIWSQISTTDKNGKRQVKEFKESYIPLEEESATLDRVIP